MYQSQEYYAKRLEEARLMSAKSAGVSFASTHSTRHANCITSQLINIAKMNPKQASFACEEANRLKIVGKYPLSQIIQKVGPMSAAQYDAWKSARTFQDNSTNSKGPDGKGVIQDKKIPVSSMGDDYDSCVKGLIDLNVDRSRAEEECSTQYKGTGNRGGKGWTTPQIQYKPNAVVSRGEGRRVLAGTKLKSASEKINAETRDYYSMTKPTTRNASVTPNSNKVPAWISVSNVDVSHLHNVTTSNIKSAAQQNDDAVYNYIITQEMGNHKDSVGYITPNLDMERLVEKRGRELNTIAAIKENQRLKSAGKKEDKYGGKPYWAYISGI